MILQFVTWFSIASATPLLPSVTIGSDSIPFPIFVQPSLRHGLDTTVSPCNDFDQYVNGQWRATTHLPDSVKSLDIFRVVAHTTELRIGALLDSLRKITRQTSHHDARVLGTYYDVCLRADSIPKVLAGVSMFRALPGDSSRAARCRRIVMNQFPDALGQIFVRATLTPPVEARMNEIVRGITAAVRTRISNLPFVPSAAKQRTLDALVYMTFKIAKPTDTIDYSGLVISSDDFNQVHRTIQEFQFKYRLTTHDGRQKTSWAYSQFNANAHFNGMSNSIEIPTFLFQWPFFENEASEPTVSYAGAGFILGHELIHGMTFKLHQEGDASVYKHPHLQRLIYQYSALPEKDSARVNGNSTINENLADLGGILVAYDAWLKAARAAAPPKIEGFTPEQRFFLHYARMWRSKSVKFSGSHSPPPARINGVVRNLPQFAAAFGCKEGNPMAFPLNERVVIW